MHISIVTSLFNLYTGAGIAIAAVVIVIILFLVGLSGCCFARQVPVFKLAHFQMKQIVDCVNFFIATTA